MMEQQKIYKTRRYLIITSNGFVV